MSEVSEGLPRTSRLARLADLVLRRARAKRESIGIMEPVVEVPQSEPRAQLVTLPNPQVVKTDSPSIVSVVSGREARALRKAAYAQQQASLVQEQGRSKVKTRGIASESAAQITAETDPAQDSEEQDEWRRRGIRGVEKSYTEIAINKEDIPWMEDASMTLALDRMTLATTKSEQFLYGDCVQVKDALRKAYGQLDVRGRRIVDSLLFTHLAKIVQDGDSSFALTLTDPVFKKKIQYFGNNGGQRVYFMRLNSVFGLPVIIRIAACDKARQAQVLGVVSTLPRRH